MYKLLKNNTLKRNSQAFTLIELLVVIAIIGILVTLAVVSLNNSRAIARDAKRLNDLRSIANALEFYYVDNNSYPSSITPGEPIEANDIVYMSSVPSNPIPHADGNCPDEEYRYTSNNLNYYSLISCLGSNTLNLPAGGIIVEAGGPIRSIGTLSGLIGWWRFEEGAGSFSYDLSGNGNNANLINNPLWVTSDCKRGGCLQFNGVNQHLDLGNTEQFNFSNTSNFTMAIWVKKIANPPDGNVIGLFAKPSKYGLDYDFSSLNFRAGIRNGSDGQYQASYYNAQNTLNEWTHLVFVYESEKSDGLRLYSDGVLRNSRTTIGLSPFYSSATLFIASSSAAVGGTSRFLNGLVDDARIYNRALSSEEILQIYNSY